MMKLRNALAAAILLVSAATVFSQQNTATPASDRYFDPNTGMAQDISRIAASVQTMTQALRDFVDKFAKVDGISLSEKQARLVMGMQLLVQSEQRLATLQKYQIELVEKEASLRTRLTQIENDLSEQALERSLAFEGGTRTPEIKESRRRALQAERASVMSVMQQVQSSLLEAGRDVREAQSFVIRLRRTYLPQVERELAEQ
ncbi:MAG TPA: hypothetical protein PKD26_08605 [Pyrinomonadaceae bacterium]|nr:hypothetical protein [Pyrinomonadaceae bacterium]